MKNVGIKIQKGDKVVFVFGKKKETIAIESIPKFLSIMAEVAEETKSRSIGEFKRLVDQGSVRMFYVRYEEKEKQS